jgi:hypothetical protein
VVSPSPVCSILLLTEDSAGDAFKTIHAVTKELLKLVDEHVQTHRIRFEPLLDTQALQAVHGNIWKSRSAKDHHKQVSLVRYVATKLMESGFVLFHIDGDRIWAERSSSENVQKFEATLRKQVEQLVSGALQKKGQPEDLSRAMARLRLLVPFYSLESWLYQNTRKARDLCEANHRAEHVDAFDEWEADRSRLDEVSEPKENCCLADRHNAALAEAYPAREVYAVGKSFTQAVDSLKGCEDLRRALAKTYLAA